jgi:hypothetical protein
VEQKPDLATLVNLVDSEARKFSSFDEFLNSGQSPEKWNKKPADGVEDNSSSESNGKVGGTDESLEPSSAAPAIVPPEPDSRKLAMERPSYIADGGKRESLAHPVAPFDAVAPEAPSEPTQMAPATRTRLEIKKIEWPATARGVAEVTSNFLVEVQEVREKDPESWKVRWVEGKSFSAEHASIVGAMEHINNLNEMIEEIKQFIRGAHAGLEERLSKATKAEREKALSASQARQKNNAKVADRMKTERVAKPGIGIKMAQDLIAAAVFGAEEVKGMVRKAGKMDDMTLAFIDKAFGGAK